MPMDTATRTSAAEVATHSDLVTRATNLCELLREDAAENDQTRRLTDRVVKELVNSGLLRLMTPRRWGGHQADLRTLLDVSIEIGRRCCATAWVTGVLNVGNFVVSLFSERAQQEMWGDNPNASSALVLGRPAPDTEVVGGGVRISGRWPYASGSLHADWMGMLVLVDRGERPTPYFALVPMEQLTVTDAWHFVGMRGTGSNTVVGDRIFVPEHRLLPYLPVLHGETDGLIDPEHRYRNSLTGVFAIGLLGSLIGAADAALRYVQDNAESRPVAGSTYRTQADSPTLQLDLATAATMIDTAKLLAQGIIDRIESAAAANANPDIQTRARARMDSTEVTRLCREAMDVLITAYGSGAFHESNPLQRLWRDVHVGSRHAGFGMGIPQQVYGRALVGRDPRDVSMLL
ncbi:acyl-CoA dehydrogenase family protein [Solwaraspora sp. WMMD791]|uniref:acyl-CoA dehydrogenase family protein n=1 Tax=Solwaraspora sp. WMMD791 TaxID=3016086 RepID=UPI00249B9354|nr:acyl-CoA dehydrogenase family protein [Solwaraspora sp. WMMD791]WFE26108.1 acyl-CoA dehydrogenase family protein [Solwaraspora sp. WMMD791]